MMARQLTCYPLGVVEYPDGLELMRQFVRARSENSTGDSLLLLEHPPVITLGRGATRENVIASPAQLDQEGVAIFETDRGGDVTYHGPGQLVGYPIFHLAPDRQDVRRYVRDVEEAIIRTLGRFDIIGHREPRWPGVWVKTAGGGVAKIAAIGVHISRWLTRHGFALNVNTRLAHFDLIVPCGISEAGVTSMEQVLKRPLPLLEVEREIASAFAEVFGASLSTAKPSLRTVAVVVRREDRRVLLVRRTPQRGGFWQVVTGKVDPGEAEGAAAERELKEETGATLDVVPLGYRHTFAFGDRSPTTLAEETAFFADWTGGEVKLDPREHEAFEWVGPHEAQARLPFSGLKTAVRLATEARPSNKQSL